MKHIKVLSTADIHFHRDYLKQFKISANKFIDTVEEEKPDLIILAGDIGDRSIANTGNSEFPELTGFIQELLYYAPVVTVQGTRSHDIPGSLEIFEQLSGNNHFKILKPGKFYALETNGQCIEMPTPEVDEYTEAILVGIPEPNKAWLLSNSDRTGEEARKAAEEALRGLLTLIAAGLQDLEVPKIGVFHGSVTGAKISDAQALPSGGIELTPSGLANLGFHYIACGHIHMRQQIAQGVWYEGSFFPKTWGEKDQKAFSKIVITSEGLMSHETIQFPHPPMEKIVIDYTPEWEEKLAKKTFLIDGFRIWLEMRIPVNMRGEMDTAKVKAQLIAKFGVTDDSRVSAKIITPETARAPEISQQKDLTDKFKIWIGSSTGLKELTQAQAEKLNEVKEIIHAQGFDHQPKRIRQDTFYAKGSIGIIKGQGKEELSINFQDYDTGLIALIGENGAGKSTMIDLCSPYADPIALDQYGNPKYRKMTDLFYLKESERTNTWTETVSGTRYKSKFIMKPQLASPKTEFYFYKWLPGDVDWELYNDDITGNKDPYEKAILEVFGSVEMYRRSAYIPQGNSDLPATTKGRKELFNELVGFEYLEIANKYAKEQGDKIEKSVEDKERTIQSLTEMLYERGNVEVIEEQILNIETSIEAGKLEHGTTETELQSQEARKETLQTQINQDNIKRAEIKRLKAEVEEIREKVNNRAEEGNIIRESIKKLPGAKKTIELNEKFEKQLQAKKDEQFILRDASQEKRLKYQERLKVLHGDQLLLDKDTYDQQQLQHQIDNDIRVNESLLETHNQKIEQLNNPCDNCGYIKPDIESLIAASREVISTTEALIKELQNEHEKVQKQIETSNNEAEIHRKTVITHENDDPDKSTETMIETKTIDEEIREITSNVAITNQNLPEARRIVEASGNGEAALQAIAKRIEELVADQLQKDTKAMDMKQEIDEDIVFEMMDLKAEITKLGNKIYELNTSMHGSTVKKAALTEKKKSWHELSDKIDEQVSGIAGQKETVSDWRLIQRGLSRDGIQALELDALAPGIAAEANALLERAYGSKFSIRFQTTKEVGSGSNKRQAEDFEVYITNNDIEDEGINKEQRLSTLSGGERIWILKSLYDAFGIIREQNTGLSFATAFQDEADGALDPEKKHLYLQMVNDAHEAAHRHHTLYITHDQAIRQAIDQAITLQRG